MDLLRLNETDAEQYRVLRIRALREHPEAFGATVEQWEEMTVDQVAERLRGASVNLCSFGAFIDGTLVGLAGFGRSENPKQKHRAGIYQMYVAPEYRGRGLGRDLLVATLDHARQQVGLEEVVLAVTVGNDTAQSLYESVGFVPIYVEPRYLKVDGIYYDIQWMGLRI
ncbi:GNAT family N-acetyltransferase [Chloroflexi bacterium TSY]|nr:GNAT family N-acetyltransferase [Chloroflexi bacterium TSY]